MNMELNFLNGRNGLFKDNLNNLKKALGTQSPRALCLEHNAVIF